MSIALLVTIGLMLLITGLSVGLWGRSHRLRPLVGGLGLALVPLGLWLFGLTDLIVQGVQGLIAWAQRTPWSTQLAWGAGLMGAGILLFIVSRWMPSEPKPVTPGTPKETTPPPAAGPRSQVGAPVPSPQASTPVVPPASTPQPPAAKKSGIDPEDAEIEALLRKRGIM